MGRAWRDFSPAAAEVFAEADRIVGARFDKSLSSICFDGPDTVLNRTDVAQPAIYAVTIACFRALHAGDAPDLGAAAGLSLGEYSALHLAGAFHSPLMAPAADRLRAALDRASIATPRCPVISNVTAKPHDPNPASIRAKLVEQLTRPVLWSDSCAWLASSLGGDFHEMAPGKTLAGLMRRIDRNVKVTSHDEPT